MCARPALASPLYANPRMGVIRRFGSDRALVRLTSLTDLAAAMSVAELPFGTASVGQFISSWREFSSRAAPMPRASDPCVVARYKAARFSRLVATAGWSGPTFCSATCRTCCAATTARSYWPCTGQLRGFLVEGVPPNTGALGMHDQGHCSQKGKRKDDEP